MNRAVDDPIAPLHRHQYQAQYAQRVRCECQDRRNQDWLPLDDVVADDLLNIWIADTLEQLPRVSEREVPTARMLLPLADRALPGARQAIDEMLDRFGSEVE